MKRFLLLVVLALTGCTDEREATQALDDNGFTDVSVTSSYPNLGFSGCSDDDGAVYKALATNPRGKRVFITVCCGGPWSFKGCTLRTP